MREPTATEIAVLLAAENNRLKVLEILRQALHDGKSLEKAIKLIEVMPLKDTLSVIAA